MSTPCSLCLNGPRNLVVCIDGTSNKYSDKSTNVVKLYRRLVKDQDVQLTYYNSGIGTYATPPRKTWKHYKRVVAHAVDMAIGRHFEKIILSAYAWLADHYKPGDRIFLFGFSRGAYQARALSAMINIVGLIHAGNVDQIPFAYELYEKSERSDATRANAARFKEIFGRNVQVHFVGAWDTVSAIGLVRQSVLHPGTADGMRHVCFFRHALALDERRVKFLPEYVCGGQGPISDADTDQRNRVLDEPRTKEVWFSGCHSDIGGSSPGDQDLTLLGPALRWMSYEAIFAGLKLAPDAAIRWEDGLVTNSMSPFWRFIDSLPIKRLSYEGRTDTVRWPPNCGRRRTVLPGQRVHETVVKRLNDNGFHAEFGVFFGLGAEGDPFTAATAVLDIIEQVLKPNLSDTEIVFRMYVIPRLEVLFSTERGQQSIRELGDQVPLALQRALALHPDSSGGSQPLREAVLRARDGLGFSFDITDFRFLSDILMGQSSPGNWSYPLPMKHGESDVTAVHYMPDGARVVSGSHDGTIFLWDIETGQQSVPTPMAWRYGAIICIDVSLAEAPRILTVFADGRFIIWDPSNVTLVHEHVVQGNRVAAAAFSPEGHQVVCGMSNGSVCRWDEASAGNTMTPIGEHEPSSTVDAIAYLRGRSQAVSGSSDKTVRLWDVDRCQSIGEPFRGHGERVKAVAFSPDGLAIASSSYDSTIRIWSIEDRSQFLVINVERDTSSVPGVVFSSLLTDWYIAAAYKKGIRIWDAKTGDTVAYMLDAEPVLALAFSPDSTRLVSGSHRSIRIWDRMIAAHGPTRRETVVDEMDDSNVVDNFSSQ